jgi:hypothetical protein
MSHLQRLLTAMVPMQVTVPQEASEFETWLLTTRHMLMMANPSLGFSICKREDKVWRIAKKKSEGVSQ